MNIRLILIQTHEAHSDLWPLGLENQPPPQLSMNDRIRRAKEFKEQEDPPYDVYIDGWDDVFEQTFRAWPDKYYFIDEDHTLLATSTYSRRKDALIDYDCLDFLSDLVTAYDDSLINPEPREETV